MAFKPHGIVVPIVTPVTQDGKFNEKAYRDLIEYLAKQRDSRRVSLRDDGRVLCA